MADLFEVAPSAVAAALGAGGNGSGANGRGSPYHAPEPPHKRLVVKATGPDADSDDRAHVFRSDAARRSDLIARRWII